MNNAPGPPRNGRKHRCAKHRCGTRVPLHLHEVGGPSARRSGLPVPASAPLQQENVPLTAKLRAAQPLPSARDSNVQGPLPSLTAPILPLSPSHRHQLSPLPSASSKISPPTDSQPVPIHTIPPSPTNPGPNPTSLLSIDPPLGSSIVPNVLAASMDLSLESQEIVEHKNPAYLGRAERQRLGIYLNGETPGTRPATVPPVDWLLVADDDDVEAQKGDGAPDDKENEEFRAVDNVSDPQEDGEPDVEENEEFEMEFETIDDASVNPWDAETNGLRVLAWEMEDRIHDNPMHTAPVQTDWMFEDRKKATKLNDNEYKALTDREYLEFAKVPPAIRKAAGQVFHKKSKFNWEVRVLLGKLAYDYSQISEPENAKYLRDALVKLEERFPDISPAHIFRQIDKLGQKVVQKWWLDIAKWIQTVAGKMNNARHMLGGHIEMLQANAKAIKYDPVKLPGLKRASINYVAWGKTVAGKNTCDELIEKEMEEWENIEENKAALEEDGKLLWPTPSQR